MTAEGLAAAIAYHRAHETSWRRDFLTESGRYIGVNDEPPAPGDVLGPVRPRGGPNGVILRGGSLVAEWGDTHRADMTFSVAKSYLAALAGLALMRGLVKDLDDPVRRRPRRRLRLAPEPRDHLAPPPPADERMAGHALEQA